MIRKTLVFCLILLVFLGACSIAEDATKNNSRATLGIITTISTKKNSAIHFFDNSLNLIESYPVAYASVGSYFYVPEVIDGKLYTRSKSEEVILEIDLKEINTTTYSIGQPGINDLRVSKNLLFCCNTLDNISIISRLDLPSKELKTKEFKDVYVSKLLCDDQRLYAFVTDLGEELSSSLYLLDRDLNLLDKVDLSSFGITQYKAIQDQNYLYFSNPTSVKDEANNLIARFNKSSHEIKSYTLDHTMPNDLLFVDDTLLIAHYNPVTAESNGISFLDLSTETVTHHKLDHGIMQMAYKEPSLYVLDEDTIYEYHIKNRQLLFIQKSLIPLDKKGSYTSGLFLMP